MTPQQKTEVKILDARPKLNALLDVAIEERSDDQKSAIVSLSETLQTLDTDLKAAILAAPDKPETLDAEKPEDRERRELRGKAKLSGFVAAVLEDRRLDGAEAECSAAFGCSGKVPLEMFESNGVESRAVTPSPATSDQVIARPIIPAIFQRSAAAWLGIDMPAVANGDAGYVVLGTSVTGGPKAKSAAADETAGAFTVTTAQPRRITGSFKFTQEDAARLAGMESALNMNLSSVLSNALDDQAINGSGSGDGTINGLLAILTNPSAPASNAETFQRYVVALGSHVDGTFAVDLGGVRMLVGAAVYRHMVSVFRAPESAMTAEGWMRDRTGGVRVSGRIAAPASNVQQAIVRRDNPQGDTVASMPVWSGLQLIRDPYSQAAKGEVIVTAVMLVGDVVVLRGGAFVQDSFRVG